MLIRNRTRQTSAGYLERQALGNPGPASVRVMLDEWRVSVVGIEEKAPL